jgi:SM-20-related protein
MDVTTALRDLEAQEYFIWDDFLTPAEIENVILDYQKIYQSGSFQKASTRNRDGIRRVNGEIRTDESYWLDPLTLTPAQAVFWDRLETLKKQINEKLFLGLWSFDGHYSLYSVNGGYQRHVDRFQDNDQRVLSMVLYFNSQWSPGDGGELRIHRPAQIPNILDVAPLGGRLVCFLSSSVVHEVMITQKCRMSFAGWWNRRP